MKYRKEVRYGNIYPEIIRTEVKSKKSVMYLPSALLPLHKFISAFSIHIVVHGLFYVYVCYLVSCYYLRTHKIKSLNFYIKMQ